MKRLGRVVTTASVLFLAATAATAGDKKVGPRSLDLKPHMLRSRFETYGERSAEACFLEGNGFRFWIAGGVAAPQAGFYSHFALAGDCEVTCTYDLLNLPQPATGYGSGVGLAFDAEDGISQGSIQRLSRLGEATGYALQSRLPAGKTKTKDQDRFVATAAVWGRIGLRRTKKELIFLACDEATEPLKEIERLPFTDQTLRVVRLFCDTGGAPTALDVRLTDIGVRADEITEGIPQLVPTASNWWPWLLTPTVGLLLFWRWRAYRKRQADAEPATKSRSAGLKKPSAWRRS